jgi:hypothetical protein
MGNQQCISAGKAEPVRQEQATVLCSEKVHAPKNKKSNGNFKEFLKCKWPPSPLR